MEKLVIFCFTLLSVVGISNAAMCISNVDCPNNATQCILNCSASAVNEFNQPASHGNCKFSVTVTGIVHHCSIDDCSTSSHPTLCIIQLSSDAREAFCCCTEDQCNHDFVLSPTTNIGLSTTSGTITVMLIHLQNMNVY